MKKHLYRFLTLFLLLCVFCGSGPDAWAAPTEDGPYYTTVMVYMCGSDLESRFGAASADITEMLKARFDTRYTRVLLMLGGAKRWTLGFDADTTTIIELGSKGLRKVWSSDEVLSMAESTTLTLFLDYAYEHYQSDRYGLIIWDHGGGPNEGVCFDELFGWKAMSIRELTFALRESAFSPRGLDWIGFDACLMADMETAAALSGYSDYMIASQALEPANGWNYAFLNGLERDADVEASGRRIIDAYFEGLDAERDPITLSMLKLSEIDAVRFAMNHYYNQQYALLTEDSYSAFSRVRSNAKSFGRAEYDSSHDYDLVDLFSLVDTSFAGTEAGEAVKNAIQNAVVLNRSNTDGANGLSVYHPCFNGKNYTEKWSEGYSGHELHMPAAYTRYIRRYAQILNGNELGDWSGPETLRETDENGNSIFSVTLSRDQLEHFDHATLLMIKRIIASNGLMENYQAVWETDYLQPDENGTIRAVFPNRAVYVVDDRTGEHLAGPIDFNITKDGQLQIAVLYSDENDFSDNELLNTMVYCSVDGDTGPVQVDSIYLCSDGTHDYSARIDITDELLRENGYTNVIFYIKDRTPVRRENDLLGYRKWDTNDSLFVGNLIKLPRSWHFEVVEYTAPQDLLFASFQITNTQNVTHASSLCPAAGCGPRTYAVEAASEVGSSLTLEDLSFTLYPESGLAVVEAVPSEASVPLTDYHTNNFVLNGTVLLDSLSYSKFSSNRLIVTLPKEQLHGVRELTRLEFELSRSLYDYRPETTEHFTLSFPEPVPLPWESEALALPFEEANLVWNLTAIDQDGIGGIRTLYSVASTGLEEHSVKLSGIALDEYYTKLYTDYMLGAGLTLYSDIMVYLHDALVDSSWTVQFALNDILYSLGVHEIGSVRLFYQLDGSEEVRAADFRLAEPVPVTLTAEPVETMHRTLLDQGDIQLILEQTGTYTDRKSGMNVLVLGFWIRNRSEAAAKVLLDSYRCNGERAFNDLWSRSAEYLLPGKTSCFAYIRMETDIPVEEIKNAEFTIYLKDRLEEAVATDVK